jgi:regulatory protein
VPVITSIKQQKKKDRVNIYLDNKFGFGIDLDNFVVLNLKLGQELTQNEIDEIIKKAEFQKTLDKLFKFAMIRPRSEKEIKDRLYRKKVPDVIHKDLFLKLKYFELLDDVKFAKWWVETRQSYQPKSKRILINELKIKGINQNIIDDILSENIIDEEKIAKEMLIKRENHWKAIDAHKLKQKMLEYLIRKGFDFGVAQKATKAYNTEEDERVK